MRLDVMAHYGIKKYFSQAGFFETAQYKQIIRQLKKAIPEGQLIALSGVVGSGKTTLLDNMHALLAQDKTVIVAQSLSVEKDRTNLKTLITALFYDVSGDNDYKVPSQGEKRERELQDLIKSVKKPVVLLVDEAHDLHHQTLIGLKRLMEVVRSGGGKLSIMLVGHPKLTNDLKGPTMEEIGHRCLTITLEGMQGQRRDYINWLLKICADEKTKPVDIITEDALDYLAEKLSTPLQIERHLLLALEEGFNLGKKPVDLSVLKETLSTRIDDLEPTLIRHGYSSRVLGTQFNLKPAEVRRFFLNELDQSRMHELTENMREAGLPI